EIEDVLKTDRYIFRDYVDERLVDSKTLNEMAEKTSDDERRQILHKIQTDKPDAVINVAVTYYTGGADTVAHIPDRCYIADGYAPSEYETPKWLVKNAGGDLREIPVRFINFEDQTGGLRGMVTKSVAYFFHVNGRYESDPLGVR